MCRLQVRQRLGAAGGAAGLRCLRHVGAARRVRRRRHHVPPRPTGLLLLHQRRAGALRGGPEAHRARHGAPGRGPSLRSWGIIGTAGPRRRAPRHVGRMARRDLRRWNGRCRCRWRRRRGGGDCPCQPHPDDAPVSSSL